MENFLCFAFKEIQPCNNYTSNTDKLAGDCVLREVSFRENAVDNENYCLFSAKSAFPWPFWCQSWLFHHIRRHAIWARPLTVSRSRNVPILRLSSASRMGRRHWRSSLSLPHGCEAECVCFQSGNEPCHPIGQARLPCINECCGPLTG